MKDTKLDKFFSYGIGCIGLVGVPATVITLFVAITQPAQVITILQQVSRVTPTPVMIVVTSQPPPIPPTASLTTTPTDTPIPTATSTPKASDDTPPGSILEIGEPWTKEDLRITPVSIDWGETALVIPIEVKNLSHSVILFSWSEENLLLVDNLGNRHPNKCGSGKKSLAPDEKYQIPCGPTIWEPPVQWTGGWWFDQNVTDLTLVITDLSRIDEARWHIPVPH